MPANNTSAGTIDKRSRKEQGMATAEYAVGTVGTAVMATVLYKLCGDGFFLDFLSQILSQITGVLPLPHDFPGPIRPWLM